jgi:putative Holliday junction resolvase
VRLLGVDHGARRIGLAIGDTATGLAFERPALRRRQLERDVASIVGLARAEGIELLVIGLPLNMDGSEGAEANAARRFGDALENAGQRVTYADERLTSWQARQDLNAAGRNAKRQTGAVDSAAARVLLQQYLDARRAPAGANAEEPP